MNPVKTFTEAGHHKVKVQLCWDLNGDQCHERTHNVKVEEATEVPPVDRVAAVSATPLSVLPAFPVQFTDTSSPGPSSVTWTFPGGRHVTQPTVRALFPKPGLRTVTAEICWVDPEGCQTTSIIITVIEDD
ncbi:MAG: hypothetical protein GY713_22595 [Actinomycetia bacterium]|nr:hypothetical protein [Actinomycetes bacterium]